MKDPLSHAVPRRAFSLALAFLVAGALSACKDAEPPPAPLAVVVAGPVHAQTAPDSDSALHYPVEVAARYSNVMSFRIDGQIVSRAVRLGDAVHQGQVVARQDPTDAQKQVASAQAQLEGAEHKLVFAKQQLDRDHAQAKRNLIATTQLEQTQDNFTAAQAARDQAAAQLKLAQNNLQYTTLMADHDGVITSENAQTGEVVKAGQAVYGLAWNGDTDINLDAAERDLGKMAVGQAASVTFAALPDKHYDAKVREISPAADPQSRTYRVKLTLLHPGPEVRLGMTGDAMLQPAGSKSAAVAHIPDATFRVPATAIFHQGKDPAVWVVKPGNTLELRPVSVADYGERTATVSAGLKDGEQIVLAGVHTVFAGEKVKPVKPLFEGEGDNSQASQPATAVTAEAAQ
ncbi:efflux RND transporter periplasmic adaptor subunit [Silvimonas amylolytica]|uniref:Lipoprotein n=1 Tax=Silvimonas amylolytica TaxID=449663 RepID=A0ABQ2PSF1_9NEIS|nr:efflux RND transporter periplasmic adaptor subunit [Silvimonas amylolytica]GGP27907.1 lipoprotein [Silvimonas amylolytica]